MSKKNDKYVFRAKDFYALLDKQEYTCALTGRELTPENTTAEHITPLRQGGKHCIGNIFLIDQKASKLKRYCTDAEVIELAVDIIKHRGSDHGYRLTRKRK